MFFLIVLLAVARPAFSFEHIPRDKRPALKAVVKGLGAYALGDFTFTLRGGYDTYLIFDNTDVAVELDWQFDDDNVARVSRIKFRQKEHGEPFLPFRRKP